MTQEESASGVHQVDVSIGDVQGVVLQQGQRLALQEVQIEALSRHLVEARDKIATLEGSAETTP
jgi:hypothetical protein